MKSLFPSVRKLPPRETLFWAAGALVLFWHLMKLLYGHLGLFYRQFPGGLHSDVLYTAEVAQDFFVDGFPLSDWNLMGYTFFFPDLLFFLSAWSLFPHQGWSYFFWSALVVLAMGWGVYQLFKSLIPLTALRIFMVLLGLNGFFLAFSGANQTPDNYLIHILLLPAIHSGAVMMGFFLVGCFMKGFGRPLRIWQLILLGVFTFLGVFSDPIFIPHYFAPLLIIFLFFHPEVSWRNFLSNFWENRKRLFSLEGWKLLSWDSFPKDAFKIGAVFLFSALMSKIFFWAAQSGQWVGLKDPPPMGWGGLKNLSNEWSFLWNDLQIFLKGNGIWGLLFVFSFLFMLWLLWDHFSKSPSFSKKERPSLMFFFISLFMTLFAAWITFNWHKGQMRYAHPIFLMPFFMTAGMLGWGMTRLPWGSLSRQLGVLMVVGILFLSFKLPSGNQHPLIQSWRAPLFHPPSYVACLDKLKRKGILKRGFADYWLRGPTNFATQAGVQLQQLKQATVGKFQWLNNEAWGYHPSKRFPHEPFRYNFYLQPGFDPKLAEKTFGKSDRILDCGGAKVHLFENEQGEDRLTRLAGEFIQKRHGVLEKGKATVRSPAPKKPPLENPYPRPPLPSL